MASKRNQRGGDAPILPLPEEKFALRPARGRGGTTKQTSVDQHVSNFARLVRALRTATSAQRPRTERGPRPVAHSQRCAIRFSYSANNVRGHFAAHARYLVRDSAAGGSLPYGNLASEGMIEALGRWQSQGDKRLYKMIVSPEFGERMDLTGLASALMVKVERDLHRKLEWAAVNHYNTDHPHIHIAIRSVDGAGREFRFDRDYIKHSIRGHAESLCTEQLGNRTLEDAQAALRREVEHFRPTAIDRAMMKELAGQPGNPQLGGHVLAPDNPLWKARLQFLASAGLVKEHGPHQWIVPEDLSWTLNQMAIAADRQRMLAKSGVAISDDKLPQSRTTLGEHTGTLRGRVLANVEEEETGKLHLILEGTDGVVHFIRHDAAITNRRNKGELKPNHFVVFAPTGAGVRVTDLGDADSYLTSPEFKRDPLPTEAASATHQWRGWLGRYHQQLDLSLPPQPQAQLHPEVQPEAQPEPDQDRDFER